MIRHIVFWKFRPDADPEPFLQALSALPEQIDWIRGMHVARSAAPNAAWDAALEVDFDTLFWNWNTGEMSLYKADRDALDIEQQQKLSIIYYTMNRESSVINGNGYYISNHYSWTGYLTTASEMLVYVKDGHETVIYENYVNLWISILCILFIAAGIIVGIYFLRRGVRRKKRSTGRNQS